MVRSRIPGGKLTSEQIAGRTRHLRTTGWRHAADHQRAKACNIHGVPKSIDLQETIRRINEIKLSTLAACGDVNRNVMCCPAPHHADPVHAEMQDLAERLAVHFAPQTGAYHEL